MRDLFGRSKAETLGVSARKLDITVKQRIVHGGAVIHQTVGAGVQSGTVRSIGKVAPRNDRQIVGQSLIGTAGNDTRRTAGTAIALHRQNIRVDGCIARRVAQFHTGHELIVEPDTQLGRTAVAGIIGQRGLQIQTNVFKRGQAKVCRGKRPHRSAPAVTNRQRSAVGIEVNAVPTGRRKQIDLRVVGRREDDIAVEKQVVGLTALIDIRSAGKGQNLFQSDRRIIVEQVIFPADLGQTGRDREIRNRLRGLGRIVDGDVLTQFNVRMRNGDVVHAEQHVVAPHGITGALQIVRHVPHLDTHQQLGIRHRTGHTKFNSGVVRFTADRGKGTLTAGTLHR